MLRGVYLTSGTQQGTPIDRLTGVLSRGFGIDQRRTPACARARAQLLPGPPAVPRSPRRGPCWYPNRLVPRGGVALLRTGYAAPGPGRCGRLRTVWRSSSVNEEEDADHFSTALDRCRTATSQLALIRSLTVVWATVPVWIRPADLTFSAPTDAAQAVRSWKTAALRPAMASTAVALERILLPRAATSRSRKFPELTMIVAVRGPLPEGVQRLANVRVFQDANYDVLPLLYNAADFTMCPSRYDPFPFVVSEALASGTPVIASPHGASLTFYNDSALKPLLTSSSDDFEGFEDAVRSVLLDPQGWRRLIHAKVRPRLEEMMAPDNWWRRFETIVGI